MSDARTCAMCGAKLLVDQEYCLDCGARARAPVRRPPHWLWPSMATAIAAAAGAAAAIAATDGDDTGPRTLVALTPLRPAAAQTAGDTQRSGTTILRWPQRDGHTVVIAVVPTAAGPEAARARARQAIAAGIPDVGVLESARFASLHPGYAVVFSGVYRTRDEALLALPAVARRFRTAYAQEIVR